MTNNDILIAALQETKLTTKSNLVTRKCVNNLDFGIFNEDSPTRVAATLSYSKFGASLSMLSSNPTISSRSTNIHETVLNTALTALTNNSPITHALRKVFVRQ